MLEFQSVFNSVGTRSACINAASLALADAGIPMRDLVTSCSSGYLNSTPLLGNSYMLFFNFHFRHIITGHFFSLRSWCLYNELFQNDIVIFCVSKS